MVFNIFIMLTEPVGDCYVSYLNYWKVYLTRSILGKSECILAHSLRVGKAWGQEDEAAGHTACTGRKPRENAGVQLTCSISFSPGSQAMECCCPHLDDNSSLQLNQHKNSLRVAQRFA